MEPGFRRRILIEPTPGLVTAELEDDYHWMVVELRHADDIVIEVTSRMPRAPWTTCDGAMTRLAQTFTGTAIEQVARRGERMTNCTHLHDLAVFAAAHAYDRAAIAYEIYVTDPVDGQREAWLWRNGAVLHQWRFQDDRIVSPATLAGRSLGELGAWIAAQDKDGAEAGRILRWGSMLALGRAIDMPAGMSATAFPGGTCYTFQPEQAMIARRKPGADIDFSAPGMEPLAGRSQTFAR